MTSEEKLDALHELRYTVAMICDHCGFAFDAPASANDLNKGLGTAVCPNCEQETKWEA